jgi:DNA-binding transcriptional regulator YdaS (Cro superfamily)
MNTTEIIAFLGGTFAVAKLCKVSAPAVSQWRNNGMPSDKLIMLAAELEKKSEGKFSRKEIENWQQIWPELR